MSPPQKVGFQGVSPVLMSSSCNVLPNNSAIPSFLDLTYPFRKSIVIEEIRWTVRAPTYGSASNLGAIVSTKLQFGRHYLMRDPVPIWLLGTLMTLAQEEGNDSFLSTQTTFSEFRWRLPEPLFLQAGEVLGSWFTRNDPYTTSFPTINVQVSYVGRTVPPNQKLPRVIPVPYVAPWVTAIGGAGGYQQSNEFNLFNPFDVPLRIQRLTGRVETASSSASGTSTLAKAVTPVTAGSAITIREDGEQQHWAVGRL